MVESHPITEYTEITPLITIGTNMHCQGHAHELTELGFYADIDLEEERQEQPPMVEYYLWLPTKDHHPSTVDQYRMGSAAIAALVAAGKRIYVHCQNGHGRSPAMVAAYFMTSGITMDEAVDLIKRRRPEIHLDDTQVAALRDFESWLKGDRHGSRQTL